MYAHVEARFVHVDDLQGGGPVVCGENVVGYACEEHPHAERDYGQVVGLLRFGHVYELGGGDYFVAAHVSRFRAVLGLACAVCFYFQKKNV